MKKFTLLILLFPLFVLTQGNPAIAEANIDDVYNQYNLTGNGVIFANMERGIDYRHPAYLKADGTTRIAYIFDMIDNTGASDPNNPYGVGTIFNEAEINASLIAGGTPLTTDRHGHGTAATGIAAGNGGGTAGLEFQGVAPEATLIVVKMIHDPFPAFGSEPAQTSFFDPNFIPIALQFIKDKVAELGLPSVTLMNFGSIGGPTDGTSSISRAMDDFINDGHVLVCGVGDDGGDDNHAFGTVSQSSTTEVLINKGAAGNLRFDLWYSENDRFDITVEDPSGTQFGPYNAPNATNGITNIFQPSFSFFHRGADVDFFGATSNTREILIDIFGAIGTYKIIITSTSITDTGEFHASLNPAGYSNNNRFLSHVQAGYSINDYTSAFNVITPGDYVVDNTYIDINGISQSRPGEGDPGEIWIGSSSGPTYDGRPGIDFVAPGEVWFAPYSPNTYYANFDFLLVQGGNDLYGLQNAVSAAAPMAAGVIALMLELDPTLTNNQIKDILNQTAREDSFTGSTPNMTWGNGKLDALAAVNEVNSVLAVDQERLDLSVKIYPNPVDRYLNIEAISNIDQATVFSILGKKIAVFEDVEQKLDLSNLKSGVYFLQLKVNGNLENVKIVKQ